MRAVFRSHIWEGRFTINHPGDSLFVLLHHRWKHTFGGVANFSRKALNRFCARSSGGAFDRGGCPPPPRLHHLSPRVPARVYEALDTPARELLAPFVAASGSPPSEVPPLEMLAFVETRLVTGKDGHDVIFIPRFFPACQVMAKRSRPHVLPPDNLTGV